MRRRYLPDGAWQSRQRLGVRRFCAAFVAGRAYGLPETLVRRTRPCCEHRFSSSSHRQSEAFRVEPAGNRRLYPEGFFLHVIGPMPLHSGSRLAVPLNASFESRQPSLSARFAKIHPFPRGIPEGELRKKMWSAKTKRLRANSITASVDRVAELPASRRQFA